MKTREELDQENADLRRMIERLKLELTKALTAIAEMHAEKIKNGRVA